MQGTPGNPKIHNMSTTSTGRRRMFGSPLAVLLGGFSLPHLHSEVNDQTAAVEKKRRRPDAFTKAAEEKRRRALKAYEPKKPNRAQKTVAVIARIQKCRRGHRCSAADLQDKLDAYNRRLHQQRQMEWRSGRGYLPHMDDDRPAKQPEPFEMVD